MARYFLKSLLILGMCASGVWAQPMGTPSTNPSTPTPPATGTMNRGTNNNNMMPGPVAPGQPPETPDTTGVNPRAPGNPNTVPSTMPPNATSPYINNSNPAADTINSNGARPGGLESNAQNQSTDIEAMEVTRKIRADLMTRKISMAAKNVTIITNGGVVTLRGRVPSNDDRATVVQVAHKYAKNVHNEIELKR